jgi:hypothetical protein
MMPSRDAQETSATITRPQLIYTTRREEQFVVTIDFGSGRTVVTYSRISQILGEREKFIPNTVTLDDLLTHGEIKTLTAILLDEQVEVVAFGYDAQKQYLELSEEDQTRHYYFQNFKMDLWQEEDGMTSWRRVLQDNEAAVDATTVGSRRQDAEREEIMVTFNEKTLPLELVISKAIEYCKNRAMQKL